MDERRMYITEAENGYFIEMSSAETPDKKKVFTTLEELLEEIKGFFDSDIPF